MASTLINCSTTGETLLVLVGLNMLKLFCSQCCKCCRDFHFPNVTCSLQKEKYIPDFEKWQDLPFDHMPINDVNVKKKFRGECSDYKMTDGDVHNLENIQVSRCRFFTNMQTFKHKHTSINCSSDSILQQKDYVGQF